MPLSLIMPGRTANRDMQRHIMKAIRAESHGGPEVLKLADAAAGRLKLNIGRVLPPAEAAEAHALMETRNTEGKLVLSVAT
ncbi:MAG: zinc-binding dehydrogenase [Verrucomicrobia bacterium]|nr:zinc-binding dehydrogenase [Verrucomicrobiota bacterium]